MRRRFFLLCLAGLAGTASAARAQPAEAPEALVRTLYDVHLAERAAGREGVLDVPVLRRRFLTTALGAAIARNRAASLEAGELLDDTLTFDPITASQEESALRGLRIRAVSATADRARVAVSFLQFETRPVELTYILVPVSGAWRVHDIILQEGQGRDGWSLRHLLGLQG